MYLDFLVKIPFVQGKITRRKKKDAVYVEYEYDRIYDPVRQYTFPKRVTIGKLSETDPELMQPNQNFLKYFPDAELPETKNRTSRSSCLRVGAYFVLRKIIEEYNLVELLGGYFEQRDLGLFLDLAVYSIIAENNAAQYYPDYTFNHPLFTNGMKQYSDSTVSDFLNSVTDDQSTGFLNSWNETRNHREKIYISYDSTNKNCQAGDIEMVEFGHPKVDVGQPVFNYAVAYIFQNKKKSADYYVEFEKAVFIFELKSGMLGIGAKQQTPNVDLIDIFYKRNIEKAYKQLKNSELEYKGDKPVIKIFLLYESMPSNTQMIISSLPELFEKDSNCYVMTIEELEMFLTTYKKDRVKFDNIVSRLITSENGARRYKSVFEVLREYQATENMQFTGEKDYFEKIVHSYIGEHTE